MVGPISSSYPTDCSVTPFSASSLAAPNTTVYSPRHQSQNHGHNDDGLAVQAPDGAGGGAAVPTKYKEQYGRWCHFVPGLGWTASKH